MFSAFQTFGRLGAGARAVAAAWTPAALWPTGTEPGMWIDPSNLAASWADYTGTTPVATPGTVADSSNPVGLALDLRLGASVLTDPGNHLLQATSTARPLESARVNLLTYTEELDAWQAFYTYAPPVVTPGYPDPDGGNTAFRVQITLAGASEYSLIRRYSSLGPSAITRSIYAKSNTASSQRFYLATEGGIENTVEVGLEFTRVSISNFGNFLDVGGVYETTGPSIDVIVWHPQLELGPDVTDYQSVPGNGSSYPATGFPIFQKYDGTDDGMATATFAAGTLSNAMDCMIAVRRDSGANAVCGLYESVAEANKVFGIAESASGSGCVGSGAGTPTVWVDGVQLTGGTAVTRGTLHTALTVGDYHVLEFRGLDLSTWTASGFGLYSSYVLTGAQGGILLFPSSTSTADRDAARTWLGKKVGLTL